MVPDEQPAATEADYDDWCGAGSGIGAPLGAAEALSSAFPLEQGLAEALSLAHRFRTSPVYGRSCCGNGSTSTSLACNARRRAVTRTRRSAVSATMMVTFLRRQLETFLRAVEAALDEPVEVVVIGGSAHVPDRRLPSLQVVEHLDVVEQLVLDLQAATIDGRDGVRQSSGGWRQVRRLPEWPARARRVSPRSADRSREPS
jgi:hypothetical protein